MPDALGWLVLGAAALVASTVGGVAGFGTGVIMVPIIAWILGIKAAVPILTVAMLIGRSCGSSRGCCSSSARRCSCSPVVDLSRQTG